MRNTTQLHTWSLWTSERCTDRGAGGASPLLFLQSMLEAQNKRIDDLMERIQLQQEKLDKQNTRIKSLQNQVML